MAGDQGRSINRQPVNAWAHGSVHDSVYPRLSPSSLEGSIMNKPTDPTTRQMAVTALTTEHFNLQTSRMGTISEANGRSSLYLGTLSSATIAIAFIGQADDLGNTFSLFAL